jgi:preprotein translocase subunit SecF
MFDIIGKYKLWFSLSILSIVLGMAAIGIWGLKFSLDFTGGSLMELRFNNGRPTTEEISTILKANGLEQSQIQPSGEQDYLIVRNACTATGEKTLFFPTYPSNLKA